MSTIVLFDMDGTLTEPREMMQENMVKAIFQLLSKTEFEVGIVTGSGFDYVLQQCAPLFDWSVVDTRRIHIFPCYGTKVFKWNTKIGAYENTYAVDMTNKLGRDNYNTILSSCLKYQSLISKDYDLPYTGTFFHYRGSMLNWCPIGRNANSGERLLWVEADEQHKIREHFLKLLVKDIDDAGISATVALGGSTSFDIYPDGWDKTYVTKHLQDYNMFFIGDKCTGTGNDRALYDMLQPDNSRETLNPSMTIELIKEITN